MRVHLIYNAATGETSEVPFTQEEEDAADQAEAAAALAVPDRVTNSQMRAALIVSGHLEAIDTFIENLPEPGRAIARAGWLHGNEVYRVSPLVQLAQAAMQWTDEYVDALFREAAKIEF